MACRPVGGKNAPVRRVLCHVGLAATLCGPCACGVSLDLGSNDAGVAYDADCKPGMYSGTYTCSLEGSLTATLPASGPLSLTLVTLGQPTTLAVGPDASVSSAISTGTAASALTGKLDCPSRKLTGTVAGATFVSAGFNATVGGAGPLSADYDGDASPPALVNGVMLPPGVGGQSESCTWSASLR
jgi:hypothetical protein